MNYALGLVLGLFFASSLAAAQIEKLAPPVLTQNSIDEKIACTRPMREGKFNISAEEKDGKVIVHCVGHGGSGCTTLWGSVAKSISLFETQFADKVHEPIHVVGTGIIGLTTAIELVRRGYTVSQITTKEFYDIPSWKNAGYFAVVSVDSDPEEQANMTAISMASYLEYKNIYEGNHPYISAECIRYLPVYCSKDTESGVEDLEELGLIPPREYVTLDFGNGVQHENFVKFMTYFMDTTRIMQELRKEVDRLGIAIEHKELQSFSELSEAVVFDCSGLGSKQLNSDDKMIAVRGHLANLNAASGLEHMNYMIYTKVHAADGSYAYVYMFPKCLQVNHAYPEGHAVYGTLGGTFIRNTDLLSDKELEVLDREEFQKLLDRNSLFFYGTTFG